MEKITLQQFLSKHKLLILDTMIFIYEFEADSYFSAQTHKIFQALEARKCRAVMSAISFHELLVKPKRAGNIPLALNYAHLLDFSPFLHVVPVGIKEAELAAGLRAKYPISAPDALVVATGLLHDADGFITADKKLSKIKEIDVFVLS